MVNWRTSAANADNIEPEQAAIAGDNQGYKEPFEDFIRKKAEPTSEMVKTLQKKLADVRERMDAV